MTLLEFSEWTQELNIVTKGLKDNSSITLLKMRQDDVETGHYYIQALDYLREIAHCLNYIAKPSFDHIDNNHKQLIPIQVTELTNLSELVTELFDNILFVINEHKYDNIENVINKQQLVLEQISVYKKKQIKRVKNKETGTKNTILYMEILSESKNLMLFVINLVKAQHDFIIENNRV